MFSIVLKSALVLIFCRIISSEMSEAVRTLCNDTYIDAADRLPNRTYRVYRGEQYWELEGLPEQSSDNHIGPLVVKGPFNMTLSYWEPLKRGDTLCTVIGNCNHNGHLFRWHQNKYTVWNTNGDIIITDKEFPAIPENGFSAVFNNGGLDPERPTLIIGFSESGVYYIKPDLNFGSTLYKEAKGFPKGQFDENFPSGVTAALPLSSIDPNVDYYVYLFRGEQYCFRPNNNVTAEDGCPEWRNSSQLFGCEFPKPTTPVPEPKQEIAVPNSKPETIRDRSVAQNSMANNRPNKPKVVKGFSGQTGTDSRTGSGNQIANNSRSDDSPTEADLETTTNGSPLDLSFTLLISIILFVDIPVLFC